MDDRYRLPDRNALETTYERLLPDYQAVLYDDQR